MKTTQIGAAKFKEQCLSILDHLEADGIIVTKHGKPVARVLPVPKKPTELIGSMKKRLIITGDIMSTGEAWESNDQP